MICERCGTEFDDSYCLHGCVECEKCGYLNWKEGGPLCICYHGTNEADAKSILEEGFRADTWFAKHLENALGFGGNHVFEVMFECKHVPNNWQFHVGRVVSASRIVSYRVLSVESMLDNPLLREEIFESNIPLEERALARKEFEIETSDMPEKQKKGKLKELRRNGRKEVKDGTNTGAERQ